MAIKLQYAISERGETVSIYNVTVKSRQGQNYLCPDPYCKEKVIPKKGEKRQHHFSHKSNSSCYGAETSLHLLAKDAISSMDSFLLPQYSLFPHDYYTFYKEEIKALEDKVGFSLTEDIYQDWSFDSLFDFYSTPPLFEAQQLYLSNYKIVIENYQGKIKPDIRLISKSNPERQLMIEVAVTHKVSSTKEDFVKVSNLALLEIDLSSFYKINKVFLVEEVQKIIVDNPGKSSWKNITRQNELLVKRKAEILPVIEEKLQSIKEAYLLVVEEYFENKDYMLREVEESSDDDLFWEEETIIRDLKKDFFLYYNNSYREIITNEKILMHFISEYRRGETYKIILENKRKKQRELKEWRKKFRDSFR